MAQAELTLSCRSDRMLYHTFGRIFHAQLLLLNLERLKVEGEQVKQLEIEKQQLMDELQVSSNVLSNVLSSHRMLHRMFCTDTDRGAA